MKKSFKVLIILLVVAVSFFALNKFKYPKLVVNTLIQEDIMHYNYFIVSPDNSWVVYSNGGFDKENVMAYKVSSKEKYNLTEKTLLGPVLASKLSGLSCWSIDSRYCFIGDYYIDFSKPKPELLSSAILPKSISEAPRTCSDCNKKPEEYNNKRCSGFYITSPDNRFTSKAETCGPLVTKLSLYIINNSNNKKSKVDIPNANSTYLHWTSDSKRLYFTQPHNVISYIEVIE